MMGGVGGWIQVEGTIGKGRRDGVGDVDMEGCVLGRQ